MGCAVIKGVGLAGSVGLHGAVRDASVSTCLAWSVLALGGCRFLRVFWFGGHGLIRLLKWAYVAFVGLGLERGAESVGSHLPVTSVGGPCGGSH